LQVQPSKGMPVWSRAGVARDSRGYLTAMGFLLWIAAVILVIAGIIALFKGSIILGIVLIVVGFAVGPGGWSIIKR
jgi:hypothetical protein